MISITTTVKRSLYCLTGSICLLIGLALLGFGIYMLIALMFNWPSKTEMDLYGPYSYLLMIFILGLFGAGLTSFGCKAISDGLPKDAV